MLAPTSTNKSPPQDVQHKSHVGEFVQADVEVAGGAGHPRPDQQPGTIGERTGHRARNQPRADLPRGEPAQGRQFSALAERVIQQERQVVQNAHFRSLFPGRLED